MVNGTGVQWDSLERRSPTLFLAAGVVLTVYAALYGLEAFAGAAYPGGRSLLLPLGYAIGFAGLLGLSPTFVDRTPTVARAGAVVAAIPIAGWVVLLAVNVGHVVGALPAASELLPGVFFLVHPAAMIVTYGLFGLAVLRTRVHSRTAGVLLLVPALLVIVLLVGGAVRSGDFPLGAFVVSSGQAMTHLAIGYAIQTKTASSDRESASDDRDRELVIHD